MTMLSIEAYASVLDICMYIYLTQRSRLFCTESKG